MRLFPVHISLKCSAGTTTFLFLILPFLFLISLSSCYTPRYVYSPTAHNVSLLTQKGDSKLGVLYSNNFPGTDKQPSGTKAYSYGLDVHSAYAVSNKMLLQLNYFMRSEKNGDDQGYTDQPEIRYRRQLVEIGAGSYKKINGSEKKILQLVGGIGYGRFSFTDKGVDAGSMPYSKFHRSNVLKFYFQPAFMYLIKKQTALSVSSRFSILHFSNIKTDYSQQQLTDYELYTLGGDPVLFWEPSFVHAIGFKKLPGFRLEYQFGFSALISRRFIDARSFNFSAGVQADVVKLFKKRAGNKKD